MCIYVCQLLGLSTFYIPMKFMDYVIYLKKVIDWMSIYMIALTKIKVLHSPCSK